MVESCVLRVLLSADPKSLSVQLDRWVKAGKMIKLRRGAYVLPEELRRTSAPIEHVANLLVSPSYITAQRALALHGLIPEGVAVVQSATVGRSREVTTPIGVFSYLHVRSAWFFGYEETEVGGGRALVALPHKALLDLIHLSRGEFSEARISELRLQDLGRMDFGALARDARRSGSPRLVRAAKRVVALAQRATVGEVEL